MFSVAVVCFLSSGSCWQPGPSNGIRVATAEKIKKATVLKCLNEVYSGVWFEDIIYIETSQYVPVELKRVGRYDSEVVSEEELIQKHTGKSRAPSLTRVRIYHSEKDPPSDFRVEICRSAVRVPGANRIPYGGGNEWHFRITDNEAVPVGKTDWVE
jgi:hypothetical protein